MMALTLTPSLLLLLLLGAVGTVGGERGPLAPGARRLMVKRGRQVELQAEDLALDLAPSTELCRVQVVTSDPASMRVGNVVPEVSNIQHIISLKTSKC